MKSQITAIIALMVIILTSAYQSSAEGPSNGGGGNAGTSTPEQIIRIVGYKGFRAQIADAFHRALWLARTEDPQLEPSLSLIKSLGPEKDLVHIIQEEKFIYKDGDCIDPQGEHKEAAATPEGICFSTSRLARVPVHSIERTLIILALHEFSHLRGMNEDQALEIEKWFTLNKTVTLPSQEELSRVSNMVTMAVQLDELLKAFKRKASGEVICLRSREIISKKSAVGRQWFFTEGDSYFYEYRFLPKALEEILMGGDPDKMPLETFELDAGCTPDFRNTKSNKQLIADAEILLLALKKLHPLFYEYTYSTLGMDDFLVRNAWSDEKIKMRHLEP